MKQTITIKVESTIRFSNNEVVEMFERNHADSVKVISNEIES